MEHIRADTKPGIIHTKSGKVLRIGSRIRARITAVSIGAAANGKIGIDRIASHTHKTTQN